MYDIDTCADESVVDEDDASWDEEDGSCAAPEVQDEDETVSARVGRG